eukprot:TRINITY_DN8917_c0_g1_i1.p1 TRINITY_DN8917_c0_g1~~TRINITY_DN8917_c0_g1_i1.p1  ORF type:complete len:293 (+),score=67.74 TRINITY_DN8917_c0_g1_i1:65-943(+)
MLAAENSPPISSIDVEHTIDIDDEPEDVNMPEFFEEVGQIKTLISLIRGNIKAIQEIYTKQSLNASDSQNSKELEALLESTNSAATQIKTRLNKMKQETTSLSAENSQKKTRTNLHGTLLKKFLEIRDEYESIENNYKERFRERIQRQAQIIKPDVTNEEIEQMMKGGTNVFVDQSLVQDKHGNAKNALMNIQEQQRDLQQLEKGFQELSQLFLELRAQADSSNQEFATVQSEFSQSVVYNQDAIDDVSKAEEYAARRRRRIAIITSSAITVGLIIVVLTIVLLYNNLNITT